MNEVAKLDQEILPVYVSKLKALGIPESYGERMELAFRIAQGLKNADMVPSSLVVYNLKGQYRNRENGVDDAATVSRVLISILKGFDVGFAPVTAVQNIMVINNKPCIYGDGANALVQASGLLEWQKVETSGTWTGKDYSVTVTMKRHGQSEPYSRTFTYKDAEKANLHVKKGPWIDYPTRQCYWRAWSWCARDGFSDALNGLSVAEELRDIETEERRRSAPVDTSSLDDAPAQIAHQVQPVMPPAKPETPDTVKPDILKELGFVEDPKEQPEFKHCPHCGGAGNVTTSLADGPVDCSVCGGSGEVPS